jgi:hypothetical protein
VIASADRLLRLIHFLLPGFPGGELLLGLFLRESVGFLDLAGEAFAFTRDDVQLIIGTAKRSLDRFEAADLL